MESLLYVSTATALPGRGVIGAILDAARRNNPRMDVTGMLLWREMRFAQYLEGPPGALDALWARLLRDPRHQDVAPLMRSPAPARLFRDWSMAGARLGPRAHWELLERGAWASDAEHAAWILVLMNDAHRRVSGRVSGRVFGRAFERQGEAS